MADESTAREKDTSSVEAKTFLPPVDIYEIPDAVVIVADLPGVEREAVDITVENRVLTLTGIAAPHAYRGHRLAYSEYDTGDFVRSFHLPDEIDEQRIEAKLADGLLHLTLPRAKARSKKIVVSV